MCLLYLFHQFDVEALAVHINYGKRGKESDKDAELVEEMAFQWGFDCHSLKLDYAEAGGNNFQQWARQERYRVFRRLADEHEADGIALAHHRDDQVETILQKQFRGSGLESWSAMQLWDGELFRPLLPASREQIEDYCEKKAVPYRTDASNLDSDFARNYLRNEWLAELEEHFPGWKENVLRISEQAGLFGKALDWIGSQLTDGKDRISRWRLLALEAGLRKSLILHKLRRIRPGIEVGRKALNQLDKLEELQTGKRVQLTGDLSLMRDREYFKMVYERQDALNLMKIELEELGENPFTINGLHFEVSDFAEPDYDEGLYLDADKIAWPLALRRWKDGDSFRPLGMEGHQKVADHLANRKVSAAHKNEALVAESFEETICAVIFPPIENQTPPGTISEKVKCDETTRQCLTIKRI